MIGTYLFSQKMSPPEAKDDYHYTMRGGINISADNLYGFVMYNIQQNSFLKIISSNKDGVIRFVSERRNQES